MKVITKNAIKVKTEIWSPSNQEIEFTCPMHSTIRQQGPGTCTICGMTLVPAAPVQGHFGEMGPILQINFLLNNNKGELSV